MSEIQFPRHSDGILFATRRRFTGYYRLEDLLASLSRWTHLGVLVMATSGCGYIEATIGQEDGSKGIDFKKTEIVANGGVPADGTSELVVAIHLKNSDTSSIPNYKPAYEIVSGAGVIASECTTSDSNGISVCVLKSTLAGFKKLRLTNALVGLEREVQFSRPIRSGRFVGIEPGANRIGSKTAYGAYVELSIGESVQGIKSTTGSHHNIFFGVRGNVVSR